jgi:hypothetical protein
MAERPAGSEEVRTFWELGSQKCISHETRRKCCSASKDMRYFRFPSSIT